jgi:hypothetical protein
MNTPEYVIAHEVILEGHYFTVVRATATLANPVENPGAPKVITAEGTAKRSGDTRPDRPTCLGKKIASGRADEALWRKISSGKHWIKIQNNMMG